MESSIFVTSHQSLITSDKQPKNSLSRDPAFKIYFSLKVKSSRFEQLTALFTTTYIFFDFSLF